MACSQTTEASAFWRAALRTAWWCSNRGPRQFDARLGIYRDTVFKKRTAHFGMVWPHEPTVPFREEKLENVSKAENSSKQERICNHCSFGSLMLLDRFAAKDQP